MTYVVVAYDISDDRSRLWVSEKLKSHGLVRIQRSLFIGRGGYYRAKEVYRGTRRYIDPSSDSIFVIVVPGEFLSRALVHGRLWSNVLIETRYLVI